MMATMLMRNKLNVVCLLMQFIIILLLYSYQNLIQFCFSFKHNATSCRSTLVAEKVPFVGNLTGYTNLFLVRAAVAGMKCSVK